MALWIRRVSLLRRKLGRSATQTVRRGGENATVTFSGNSASEIQLSGFYRIPNKRPNIIINRAEAPQAVREMWKGRVQGTNPCPTQRTKATIVCGSRGAKFEAKLFSNSRNLACYKAIENVVHQQLCSTKMIETERNLISWNCKRDINTLFGVKQS